ncbi:MAG: ubiquinol-cytochrome c reductase iron-sulfur subunit [Nitrososphaerota archaeon]|nr:ubiquinol-cytochrome c reductase iron-sulfur subunit [Nitrososphaerota archaeon]MDG6922120.1 ubiquinol-cytochrome c reductase iron-sulfur subunit [Nitrososphaerota archaeon]
MSKGKLAERKITKQQAREALRNLKRYIGISLLASFSFGVYLLVTDKSLWLLAVSHAYGLVAISVIDLALGLIILGIDSNNMLIPSGGWAFLTILLQIGDITTAPQYKMAILYFAHYLFGLWAFDGLLVTQGVIVAAVLYSRSYQKMLAKKKVLTYFDMGLNKSRRDFIQIGGTIGGFFLLAAILGAWTVFSTPRSSASQSQSNGQIGSGQTTNNLPSGAVANVNQMSVGSPVYFDYPYSGYPNILIKKSDGTVSAMSMLCTHVCCQCEYSGAANEIYCPCHGSIFDISGNVLRGPAQQPLPSVELSIDSNGNVFPVKMNGSSACV